MKMLIISKLCQKKHRSLTNVACVDQTKLFGSTDRICAGEMFTFFCFDPRDHRGQCWLMQLLVLFKYRVLFKKRHFGTFSDDLQ